MLSMFLISSLQVATRLENELYLRNHPEVHVLLSSFVRYVYLLLSDHFVLKWIYTTTDWFHYSEVLLKRPRSISEFAAG